MTIRRARPTSVTAIRLALSAVSGDTTSQAHGGTPPSAVDAEALDAVVPAVGCSALMGGEGREAFERLYLLPGVYHCSKGEGPGRIDALTPCARRHRRARHHCPGHPVPPGVYLSVRGDLRRQGRSERGLELSAGTPTLLGKAAELGRRGFLSAVLSGPALNPEPRLGIRVRLPVSC
jgi:hypothetical protein